MKALRIKESKKIGSVILQLLNEKYKCKEEFTVRDKKISHATAPELIKILLKMYINKKL